MHDGQHQFEDLWRSAELRVFFEPDPPMRREMALRDISFPYVQMSRAKHLYILTDVARLARARSLSVTWPIDNDPNWAVPSLSLLAALSADPVSGRRFALELANARFIRGADICSRVVLAECARLAGLSASLADCVDDPAAREHGLRAMEDVATTGVFGVPFLVIGRETFWGLERLPIAQAALACRDASGRGSAADAAITQLNARSARRQKVPAQSTADADHAGGCG